jgi:phosphoesterase family protein
MSRKILLVPVVVAIVAAALLVAGSGLGWFSTIGPSGPTPPPSSSPQSVDFSESGLPNGTTWSVTLAGLTTQSIAPHPITFDVASGSYSFGVEPVAGYSQSPASGSVSVQNAPASVTVDFTSMGFAIQHVVVIMLENSDLNTVLAYAPYLDYLWNTYGHVTQFYPACHGSMPDYTSIESGRYYVCGGSVPTSAAKDLPDVLEASSLTWGGYFESMPKPCDPTWDGQIYDPSHNPFLVSEDIIGNTTRCDTHVVNSAAFNTSVAAGTLPSFSMYVPNTQDDCEYSQLPVCDNWLRAFLSPLLNSTTPAVQQLMQHTAFFIAFDEGMTYQGYSVGGLVNNYCQTSTGQALTVCGGHAYLAVVSPYSYGTQYTTDTTGYGLETTIEWLLGVGNDGGYDGTPNFPSMTTLFTPSSSA